MSNKESFKFFFLKNLWLRIFVFALLFAISRVDGPAKDLGWINSIIYVFEDFSILISLCIFVVYFSIRNRLEDFHSHLIGTGFLIIGILDFYRAITSPEVTPIFQTATTLLHHELNGLVFDGILLLFLLLVFIPQNRPCKFSVLNYSIPIASMIAALTLTLFIVHPSFMPAIYIPGEGSTKFYVISKIILTLLFGFCSFKFHQKNLMIIKNPLENDFLSKRLQAKYLNLGIAARLLAGASLALVMMDFDNDLNDQLLDILNHILKMIAFIFVYRAVIKSTLLMPYLENVAYSIELDNKIKNNEALELELKNVRKLAAVGQHVDSIAHDMGNLLMMIAVTNDKFLESDEYTEVEKNVSNIHRVIDKCKGFLSSLIRFTKNIDQPFEKFKFTEHIEEFKKNIDPIISVNNIDLEVKLNCSCELVMVKADLDQILFNLVFNAKDAIKPKVGKISISSRTENISNKQDVFGVDMLEGVYCMITVSDTGKGIPKVQWRQIFDPFNSNKADGKNYGLGLSTVLNILNKYQGYIDINSEVGVGSSFSIYLPYDSKRLTSLAILNSKI